MPLGVAKVGGYGGNGSGDIFITFSTGNPEAFSRETTTSMEMVSNDNMNPIIHAVVDATEEAIINAMIAAETMKGRDDNISFAIPHDRLQDALRKYNRLVE